MVGFGRRRQSGMAPLRSLTLAGRRISVKPVSSRPRFCVA